MREQAERYLAMRRALGHRLEGQGRLLLDFADKMDRASHARLTTAAALDWDAHCRREVSRAAKLGLEPLERVTPASADTRTSTRSRTPRPDSGNRPDR
jgi:hypothetical protein